MYSYNKQQAAFRIDGLTKYEPKKVYLDFKITRASFIYEEKRRPLEKKMKIVFMLKNKNDDIFWGSKRLAVYYRSILTQPV